MKTVPIEEGVAQTNATQVFTYGGSGAEPQAAEDHGLRNYRQGLAEKFYLGVPVRRLKNTNVFPRKREL